MYAVCPLNGFAVEGEARTCIEMRDGISLGALIDERYWEASFAVFACAHFRGRRDGQMRGGIAECFPPERR